MKKYDCIIIGSGQAGTPLARKLAEAGRKTLTILDLEELPEHLLITGGNYIGLEFGQMFRRFGSKVTILERSPRILFREDEDVSEEMTSILKQEDIAIHCAARVTTIGQSADGKITANVTVDGKEQKIECSHVLIAIGRTAQTEGLGLEKTGVETDEKGKCCACH